MQEVVKRIQERQEKQKEVKLPDRVTLCIVRWADKNYPVILPRLFHLNPGDLVWFKPRSNMECGTVVYTNDFCEPNEDIWTLVTITTGMEPIRACRYAQISDVKWEEENK